jgi:hypothetical protein
MSLHFNISAFALLAAPREPTKEIEGLHEGNFMRYRLNPNQFKTWAERS